MPVTDHASIRQPVSGALKMLTAVDGLLICAIIGAGMASIPLIRSGMPVTVAVYRDNALYGEYPLDQDREVAVRGQEGMLTLTIRDGSAFVASSSCRRQVCVKSGAVSTPYRQLVCAPNHILIEIRANKTAPREVDAITQ